MTRSSDSGLPDGHSGPIAPPHLVNASDRAPVLIAHRNIRFRARQTMHHTRRAFALSAAATGALALLPSHARAQATLSGTFVANGKAATLTQVTAHEGDPHSFGKPVTELVFTANDQKGDTNAAFNATFHRYGDAIVAKVAADGSVLGIGLVHSALRKSGIALNATGVVKIANFSASGGQISGRLTSGGPKTVSDEAFEVDLSFKVKAP